MARLHSLYRPPSLLHRFPHRCDDHSDRGALSRSKLGVRQRLFNIQSILQKRREMIIDLLITIGIPVLQMLMGKRDLLSILLFPMNTI